jgi:hypothetical protein
VSQKQIVQNAARPHDIVNLGAILVPILSILKRKELDGERESDLQNVHIENSWPKSEICISEFQKCIQCPFGQIPTERSTVYATDLKCAAKLLRNHNE